MRLCRFLRQGKVEVGFYYDDRVVPVADAAAEFGRQAGREISLPGGCDLLRLLPPDGEGLETVREIFRWLDPNVEESGTVALPVSMTDLLAPVPRPGKLLLLAGNYAAHIEEGGDVAVMREKTFPHVFMKPPATTINNPGGAVPIPEVSPDHIDWEAELGVVIGRRARGVPESRALEHVAGYTVINDISDRRFRPNPEREERDRDRFFDWLHGKWHDGSCPMGPCVVSADAVPDPQNLRLTLKVNGETRQDASTAQQIFPVAAVVAFISSWVTLAPGDVISTGTPAGVGSTTGTYLKPGDIVEASIEGIGVLRNPMVSETGEEPC